MLTSSRRKKYGGDESKVIASKGISTPVRCGEVVSKKKMRDASFK